MRKIFSLKSYLALGTAFFMVGLFYFLNINIASADNGGIDINVKQELGSNLSGAAVQIQCAGGTWAGFGVTDGSGNISVLQAALPAGANCETDDEQIDIQLSKDGYVSLQSLSVAGNYRTGSQNTYNITGVQFGHKFIIKNELNTNLTPDSATAGANLTACTISTNNAYCPVPLADDDTVANGAVIVKDGYVTTAAADVPLAGDRTAGTDAQQVTTMDATNGLDFSHKFLVKDELGTALTVTSATAGGASVACTISTSTAYCPVLLADDDTVANGLVAIKDGYVTTTAADVPLASDRTAGTDAQGVTTLTTTNGLDFSHKIVVKDELNAALTPDTVTGGANDTSCTVSSNSAYCAIPLADDNVLDGTTAYEVIKDGYVTTTPNLAGSRGAGTTAQQVVTMNATTGLDFAYKITSITAETLLTNLTATVTTLEVGDGTGRNACTLSGGAWYCPVVLANSNGTLISRVIQDGYVEKLTYALVTGTTRLLGTTAQLSDTIVDIQQGVKVTVVQQTTGTALSSATVTDNAGATACVENGTTGVYYCIVPLASTSRVVAVSKDGYVSDTAPHTDRTAHTDAQQTLTFNLAPTGSSGGGGGGGGGGGSSAPEQTPTTQQNSNSSLVYSDIITLIDREKTLVAGQANSETYFINTGTETTLGLGKGERGAAVSSYKEAYGSGPKSEANWTDVLNIANGRWPLTVNKAVESRAYTNFKLVYGRNANMKNSTDVNALKMMGYGVRSTGDRDLTKENNSIKNFKKIFGMSPKTARHWNIVRAMTYSGVVK